MALPAPKKDQNIGLIPISMADEDNIPLTSNKDVKITVSKAKKNAIETEIVPIENLRAPIKKGDVVATLKIIIPKSEIQSIDLIAAKDIAEAGYISSFFSYLYSVFVGLFD